MIKAFLFDYDGVMTVAAPDSVLPARLAANIGVSPGLAAEWIKPLWAPMLKAELSLDDFWRTIEEKYGQAIALPHRDIWFRWSDMRLLPEMQAKIRQLKLAGYKLGILSNAVVATYDEICANNGYDGFDFKIVSCNVGCKKPEPEIFELAMSRLGDVQPGEVVFLDDRAHNAQAADDFGMHGIHVTSASQAIGEIDRLVAGQDKF